MPLLLVAIVAMLAQQTLATAAKTGVLVLFKPMADELQFDAELVLVYTWGFACVGITVMLGCGAFIRRFGALRMTQIGCVLMAIGLALLSTTAAPMILVVAILALVAATISMGGTLSTPASSQILARYAPARWAPLVFSIKQTGVPAGVVLVSFLVPLITTHYGWRAAGLFFAGLCLLIAVALQPCRKTFDQNRQPDYPLRFSSLADTFLAVLRVPGLRMLAIAAFAFIGLQSIFLNFSVVYLAEELGYELSVAGAALGTATLIALPGRVFWGWVSSVWIKPRTLLICLALAMIGASIALGLAEPEWAYWQVMLPLLVLSATAMSWHGVLLSETARLSPDDEVARMTGGVLAFGTAGQIGFPILFALGFALGEYAGAYAIITIPAIVAVIAMSSAPKHTTDETQQT